MSGTQAITNPNGAFGQAAQFGANEIECVASAAITGPAVVAVGTTGLIATAATNGTASLAIGIARKTIASAASGPVVVTGYVASVPCAGAVAAGDILKRSVTTAGYVSATATPAVGEALGVAINASSSNVVNVWVAPSL